MNVFTGGIKKWKGAGSQKQRAGDTNVETPWGFVQRTCPKMDACL